MSEEQESPAPKTEEEFEMQNYPMPSKDKPLKVNAKELEAVVLIPKGYETGEPEEVEEEKPPVEATPQPQLEQQNPPQANPELEKEKEELQRQVKEYQEKAEELEKQLNDIETTKKEELSTQIIDGRLSKNLMEESEKEPVMKNLMSLPTCQLEVLLADLSKMPEAPPAEPQPKTGEQHEELSEDDQMSKLREEMFGHKEPLP